MKCSRDAFLPALAVVGAIVLTLATADGRLGMAAVVYEEPQPFMKTLDLMRQFDDFVDWSLNAPQRSVDAPHAVSADSSQQSEQYDDLVPLFALWADIDDGQDESARAAEDAAADIGGTHEDRPVADGAAADTVDEDSGLDDLQAGDYDPSSDPSSDGITRQPVSTSNRPIAQLMTLWAQQTLANWRGSLVAVARQIMAAAADLERLQEKSGGKEPVVGRGNQRSFSSAEVR